MYLPFLGTLAGTSLADLVFVISLARVTQVVDDRLAQLDLHVHFDPQDALDISGGDEDNAPLVARVLLLAWVDDYALPVVCT